MQKTLYIGLDVHNLSAEALSEGGRDTPKDSRKLESGDSGSRIPACFGFPPDTNHAGDEMRRPIIAYNGLPVQMLSRRDFLFPDADEKYVPAVLAYIHDTDQWAERLAAGGRPMLPHLM
jgi:hypothetical protein